MECIKKCILLSFCAVAVFGISVVKIEEGNGVTLNDTFVSFSMDNDLFKAIGSRKDWKCYLCASKGLSPAYVMIDPKVQEINDTKEILKWIKDYRFTPMLVLRDLSVDFITKSFEIANEAAVNNCIWVLKFDCVDEESFEGGVIRFKNLIDAFMSKNQWNVYADLSECPSKSTLINALQNVTDKIITNNDYNNTLNMPNEIKFWKFDNSKVNDSDANGLKWLKEVGESAKDGYSAIFKHFTEEEVENSKLVFVAAMFHKYFAGSKVLEVKSVSHQEGVSVFAQCTTLPFGFIPNGVTLYAVNEGEEPADIAIEGMGSGDGDILQYIIQLNDQKQILINNETLTSQSSHDGYRRENQFDSLKISLPPKSIGFWINFNTNISTCFNLNDTNTRLRRSVSNSTSQDILDKLNEFINEANSIFEVEQEMINLGNTMLKLDADLDEAFNKNVTVVEGGYQIEFERRNNSIQNELLKKDGDKINELVERARNLVRKIHQEEDRSGVVDSPLRESLKGLKVKEVTKKLTDDLMNYKSEVVGISKRVKEELRLPRRLRNMHKRSVDDRLNEIDSGLEFEEESHIQTVPLEVSGQGEELPKPHKFSWEDIKSHFEDFSKDESGAMGNIVGGIRDLFGKVSKATSEWWNNLKS